MRSISVRQDSDGCQDIQVDANGNLEIVDEFESAVQRVRLALQFWRGEWFLNESEGVPYLQVIFNRPVTPKLASSVLTDTILRVDDIQSVSNVQAEINPATRHLVYSVDVVTRFGTGTLQGEL